MNEQTRMDNVIIGVIIGAIYGWLVNAMEIFSVELETDMFALPKYMFTPLFIDILGGMLSGLIVADIRFNAGKQIDSIGMGFQVCFLTSVILSLIPDFLVARKIGFLDYQIGYVADALFTGVGMGLASILIAIILGPVVTIICRFLARS